MGALAIDNNVSYAACGIAIGTWYWMYTVKRSWPMQSIRELVDDLSDAHLLVGRGIQDRQR